jgi:hypothetical protein
VYRVDVHPELECFLSVVLAVGQAVFAVGRLVPPVVGAVLDAAAHVPPWVFLAAACLVAAARMKNRGRPMTLEARQLAARLEAKRRAKVAHQAAVQAAREEHERLEAALAEKARRKDGGHQAHRETSDQPPPLAPVDIVPPDVSAAGEVLGVEPSAATAAQVQGLHRRGVLTLHLNDYPRDSAERAAAERRWRELNVARDRLLAFVRERV